ncbi:MAG: hypothetical protein CVV24_03955 [Ignavibacteriae bacterium HGW-Ignavibacteriae-3]|nr:MAG: hypothetical protein CVV24_03955 [Ignavibacteriae bacterium HGW-Ignavibacteriae-3]
MKLKIPLVIRLILGVLFLLSAYSKMISPGLIEIILLDHGLAASRETAAVVVRILIGFEFALGLSFFQPFAIKQIVVPVSILFLIGFTIYLGYTALILKDAQNCGCFGEMIKMSPVESIIKNIVLIGMLILVFKLSVEKKNYFIVPVITIISIALVFIFIPIKSQNDLLFAQYTNFNDAGRVDLSQGEKLIAIFNTECDHCQHLAADLTVMSQKAKQLPEIYALMFTEGTVTPDSFKVLTGSDFPYHMIEMNEFFSLIGQSPPRLYWLIDGTVKEFWDKDFIENIEKKILQN